MSNTVQTDADLESIKRRLAELELENAKLMEAREKEASQVHKRHFSWRTFGSVLLIVLATVLAPLATVTGWAKSELVNERDFVATFAPLASEPTVQAEIASQVSAAIEVEFDIDGLVGSVFDGLASLDMPSEAQSALGLLRDPATQGVHSIVSTAVTELVESEVFADTWSTVLIASHRAFVAAAQGSAADGAITVENGGDIVLHLGPVVKEVKDALVAQGLGVAGQIPDINPTVALAHSDALGYIVPIYHTAVALGWLLPFASFFLFVGGILLARDRRKGSTGAGVGLAVGGGTTLILLSIAETFVTSQAGNIGVSSAALSTVYSHVVGGMRGTAITLILLGVLLIIMAWITGPSNDATAIRDIVGRGTSNLAVSLRRYGFKGGSFAQWLLAQRSLTRTILVILVVAALILLPVTVTVVLWIAVIALLLWWVICVLEKVAALEDGAELSEEIVDSETQVEDEEVVTLS